MSKVLVVFGATGNQGGSVIKAVLSDPELSKTYKIRAVTRDPSKESGKKLAAQGAEVVKGDLDDAASLAEVVKGASVVFGVTNYWEYLDAKRELKQGKAIVDAAVAANVEYIIFSTLPHVTKQSGGKLHKVEHFDSKADIEEYIRSKGIPAAFYQPAMFYQFFPGMVQPTENGEFAMYTSLAGDKPYAFLDVSEDSGKFVAPVLKNPVAFQNQQIIGVSSFLTPNEVAETLGKAQGKKITYHQVSDDAFVQALKGHVGEKGAEELGENFIWVREYNYYGPDQTKLYEQTKKLISTPMTTFEEFAKRL